MLHRNETDLAVGPMALSDLAMDVTDNLQPLLRTKYDSESSPVGVFSPTYITHQFSDFLQTTWDYCAMGRLSETVQLTGLARNRTLASSQFSYFALSVRYRVTLWL